LSGTDGRGIAVVLRSPKLLGSQGLYLARLPAVVAATIAGVTDDETNDYRATIAARKQRWFGLKGGVKRFLSLAIPHAVMRGVVRLIPRLRSGRLPAPARLNEVEGTVMGHTFVMLGPDRCENAKELYWGRGRRTRPEDARSLEAVVRLTRDARVFVDIGAYTGLFTLATTAVNRTLLAHAFEIVPAVGDALRANIVRNGVADRAIVHPEGVGDPETRMRVPSGMEGSALPSFYSARMHFSGGAMVPFRSLDSVGDLMGPGSAVVMKIDVEGTENAVFRFGQTFLGRYGPDMLCEVLEGVADAPELRSLLDPHGYRFYLVRAEGLEERRTIVPDGRSRDWLFSRRDPGELVELGIPVTGQERSV
jgi:FkbM family methyltransferase